MSMIILSGILLIAMILADVVLTGIQMGGTQARSTKAYFAAEAGMEKLLWEYRQNDYEGEMSYHGPYPEVETNIFTKTLGNAANYSVSYEVNQDDEDWVVKRFVSVGGYRDVRRSVRVTIRYPEYYLDF